MREAWEPVARGPGLQAEGGRRPSGHMHTRHKALASHPQPGDCRHTELSVAKVRESSGTAMEGPAREP